VGEGERAFAGEIRVTGEKSPRGVESVYELEGYRWLLRDVERVEVKGVCVMQKGCQRRLRRGREQWVMAAPLRVAESNRVVCSFRFLRADGNGAKAKTVG
jgi:hypothetical protein